MTDRFLPTALRRALEKAVKAAREVAEEGAADAVRRLGVADATPPAHLSEDAKGLRRRLRAHARTLGDTVIADGIQEVRHLVEATGYAQWHRRLFARFLAERGLLRHPEHGPVTLEDCEELAKLEGFADAWAAAEACGARMLPGVFLPDDPVLALELAPEHAQALRRLVDGLDAAIFQADDSLGWTYQFWRAAEKDRVNRAGEKIGARDLPAVTQLFTEPYMVKFLLHNTLGAWRAGKVLAAQPELAANAVDEAELRTAVSPPHYAFDMLRFVREGEDAPRWRPAAGTFQGWPKAAAAIRALDPCCGSGHFLTEMLAILSALRADEEGLADAEAVAAALRDNLFGLELDGRCVQIAAFAVALTAWRIGGFQPFGSEQVHIAWVGAPPPLDRGEFLALANGDDELRHGLTGLHDLFVQAPLLGSLIDPTGGDLMSSQRLGRIEPLLDRLVEKTRTAEPERAEGAVAAKGMADAAAILSGRYTLVATNVPFLGQRRQSVQLSQHLADYFRLGKADLSSAMTIRGLGLSENLGTMAVVTPQSWYFQSSFEKLRIDLLNRCAFNFVAPLGSGAFETITGEVVNTSLTIISRGGDRSYIAPILDCNDVGRSSKIEALCKADAKWCAQSAMLEQPSSRISVAVSGSSHKRLQEYSLTYQGIKTGDDFRHLQRFWEGRGLSNSWLFMQTTVDQSQLYSGATMRVRWENDGKNLVRGRREGQLAAARYPAVAVTQMSDLPATIMTSKAFDSNVSPIFVKDSANLAAVYAFCADPSYRAAVKKIEPSMKANNTTLLEVPFDVEYWKAVAAKRFPDGLPEPCSDDPTQWLFHGHPAQAVSGTQLHVALARLAGYSWPAESDTEMRLSADARRWIGKSAALPAADNDGILCVEAVAGEQPLAQRLRSVLAAAFGDAWSDALERGLVAEADHALDKRVARDGSLETWLRDRAFRQHCRLFHDRPFVWQVWDGSPDGFSAFVHYHRLDAATLGKLTYTVLGDWIGRMTNAGDERRVEAAKILQQRLTAILGGEAPFDIFVRWKPLERQPIGWDPDLDDGVRLNIRPFVEAGVLREAPKIKWGMDRGSDAPSAPWFPKDKGKRNNDHHLKLADKQAARGAK